MPKIKNKLSQKEITYDKDRCIDLTLMEEPEHQSSVYWLKEAGGENAIWQDKGDGDYCIDILPHDFVIKGCKYYKNTLIIANGSGKNRVYRRSDPDRLFKLDKTLLSANHQKREPFRISAPKYSGIEKF